MSHAPDDEPTLDLSAEMIDPNNEDPPVDVVTGGDEEHEGPGTGESAD